MTNKITSGKFAVINTGGTMDSKPYLDIDNPPLDSESLEHSLVPKLIEYLNLSDRATYYEHNKKDSKYFSLQDLAALARFIGEIPEQKIVIIHGTDKMAENARALNKILKSLSIEKEIVFTGTYIPLSNGMDLSRGTINLFNAVEHLDNIDLKNRSPENNTKKDSSVCISMDNKIFTNLENLFKKKKISFEFTYDKQREIGMVK